MSQPKPEVGSIGWIDLTLPDAEPMPDDVELKVEMHLAALEEMVAGLER